MRPAGADWSLTYLHILAGACICWALLEALSLSVCQPCMQIHREFHIYSKPVPHEDPTPMRGLT